MRGGEKRESFGFHKQFATVLLQEEAGAARIRANGPQIKSALVASTAASMGLDIGFAASARSNATKRVQRARLATSGGYARTYLLCSLFLHSMLSRARQSRRLAAAAPAAAPRYNKKATTAYGFLDHPLPTHADAATSPRQNNARALEPWSSSCPTPQQQQRTVAPPHGPCRLVGWSLAERDKGANAGAAAATAALVMHGPGHPAETSGCSVIIRPLVAKMHSPLHSMSLMHNA